MKTQNQNLAYKRGNFSQRRQGNERDPYVFVLSGQIALCLLMVLLAFVVRDARPSFWQPMTEGYITLLTRPMSSDEWKLDNIGQWYITWKERTLDAVAEGVEALITQREQPEPDMALVPTSEPTLVPVLDPATATVLAPARTSALMQGAITPEQELLTGAGGWFGDGEQTLSVPSGCSFAPILLSTRLTAPISGKITSRFGWREHPITEETDFHRGLDVAAVMGSSIRAPLPGVVSEVGESAIYGNFITLTHSGGVQTTYAHCDTIIARQGENLRAGELLATVGSTGISTGPHLHFEIKKNGVYYNPIWTLSQENRDGI